MTDWPRRERDARIELTGTAPSLPLRSHQVGRAAELFVVPCMSSAYPGELYLGNPFRSA